LSKSHLKVVRSLENNAVVAAKWKSLNMPHKEFVRIGTERGDSLDAWILRPADASAANKRPAVMFQYSGPASQRVLNRWHHRIAYVLADMGYVVINADPRGTDCRGREWRNATYLNLGKKEAEDHLSVASYMQSLPYVDGTRIAMAGWSYGGYQTLYTMSQKNHPFKAGVAIAPVTDWKLYDTGYTERYMRRPQVNPRGYEEASLLNKAADLKGNVLIIHGTADDNVHVQHTMQYIDALVRANKQFEMQLYPDDNHFLRKGNNATHMHNRILNFLQNNLKQ
jgi:dipeptidyl-peptidase-4